MNNLTGLLQATGRYEEAGPLFREELAVVTASLGADHPSSKIVAGNLARLEAEMAGDGGAE